MPRWGILNTGPVKVMGKNPFLTYGLIGLLLGALISLTGSEYDAGGWRGALFWTGQIFSLPFWMISEVLFALNHSEAVRGHDVISVTLGIILCLLLDVLVRWMVRLRRRRRSS